MRRVLFTVFALAWALQARAQFSTDEPNRDEERKLGWSNVADFGFVLTSGNSSTSTLTFDDKLTRAWKNAELSFRGGALRTNTVDDSFAVGTPDDFRIIEDDSRELDTERYFVEGRYDRDITERFFWVVGAGWDRDTDAGIENRNVVFAGVGNTWRNDDHLRFKTDYALTFTRQIDEIVNPERDENFSEVRLSWDYMHQFAKETRFDSNFIFFVNVSDANDYHFNTINAVTTNMTSLQFLYQNFPTLEAIDLFNLDPGQGGVGIGTAVVPRKKLDTVVKFALVLTLEGSF